MSEGLLDRFWSKVDVRGPDECWLWMAAVDCNGYGKFWLDGKNRGAHRVALALELGRPVDGCVLRSCDVRTCCNTAHLREGNHKDNSADARARGRQTTLRGEQNPGHKLRLREVNELRAWLRVGGWTHDQLGDAFGVSRSLIGAIARGERWGNVYPRVALP